MKLNVARVWTLPPGKKVKVEFNRDRQPIEDEGALLNSFLASLASDVNVLPICYRDWRKVPKSDKDRCYNKFLKEKFQFDESIGEKYMRGVLGKDWKDNRHRLFKELYKVEWSREDNLRYHPPGIPKEQWASFIDYRLQQKTMKMCETNTANRKKLITPHTGGSKSLSRKRNEMEKIIEIESE